MRSKTSGYSRMSCSEGFLYTGEKSGSAGRRAVSLERVQKSLYDYYYHYYYYYYYDYYYFYYCIYYYCIPTTTTSTTALKMRKRRMGRKVQLSRKSRQRCSGEDQQHLLCLHSDPVTIFIQTIVEKWKCMHLRTGWERLVGL